MRTKKGAKKKETKSSLFMQSLKELDKRLIHIIMFDVLFYLVLIGIVFFTFNNLKWNFEAVKESIPALASIVSEVDQIMPTDTASQLTEVNAAFFVVIARTILILVAVFIFSMLIGIFFKALVWTRILHKKFDIHYYRRFTLLNLLWILPWALVIVVLLFMIKSMVVFWYVIGIIFIFLHFTNILYVLFEKEKKFSGILRDTFILGVVRLYYFIVPYIWAMLIFFILFNILGLFSFLPWKIYLVFFILVLFIYFAWVRIYISKVILHNLAQIS